MQRQQRDNDAFRLGRRHLWDSYPALWTHKPAFRAAHKSQVGRVFIGLLRPGNRVFNVARRSWIYIILSRALKITKCPQSKTTSEMSYENRATQYNTANNACCRLNHYCRRRSKNRKIKTLVCHHRTHRNLSVYYRGLPLPNKCLFFYLFKSQSQIEKIISLRISFHLFYFLLFNLVSRTFFFLFFFFHKNTYATNLVFTHNCYRRTIEYYTYDIIFCF